MATRQYILRIVDLTQPDPSCLVPATVNQAFDTAQPETDIGFIIASETAPDVVTYPVLKRFLWGKLASGQLTGDFYFFNGTDWVLFNLSDGAKILDGTITIDKFSTDGASALDIIQVNADASGYQFTSVIGAIPVGQLPLNRLNATGIPNGYLLAVQGEVVTAINFDGAAIIAKLVDNSIPINKLVRGAANNVLATNADATATAWATVISLIADNTLEITKIARGAGNGKKFLQQNDDGSLLQWTTLQYTFTTVVTSEKFDIPAAGFQQLYAHGQAKYPFAWQACFECIEVNNGYSVGDRIDHTEVTTGGGNDERPAFVAAVNISNVTLTQAGAGLPGQRNFLAKDTGAAADFAAAATKWKLVFVLTFVA